MRGIAILGAGLSGLTAAINLAKERYTVDVYEKKKDVGMRFRGDIQGLENWSRKKDILKEMKEMNVGINFDCAPFSKVILTNCSISEEVHFKRPLFYLLKRGPFPDTIDYGLKAQALGLGVNIHYGKTLAPDKADIVATGPVPEEAPAVVKGIIFKTDVEDVAILLCNDEFAFKMYAYLLITRGYGCMCTVVAVDQLHMVNEYFERTKLYFSRTIGLDAQSPKEVGGLGSFSSKGVYRKGTTSYIGEAAGLQDFLWGFGMRFAVTSGYLAAKSIIDNLDYAQIAKRRFENSLKASVVNRYVWEEVASRKDYLFAVKFAEFLKRTLYPMHNYNLLHRILYPIASRHLKKIYPQLRL